jgi:hypothetical protein
MIFEDMAIGNEYTPTVCMLIIFFFFFFQVRDFSLTIIKTDLKHLSIDICQFYSLKATIASA